ncbi:hypothetical protein AVEN_220326-1 [Araneus ventricosus]|uniref:Uncharacterized protein n=1 Tax=Araneus ventricosus TaxID=182803 RepID=A0A4Y1ZN47_ARAVE|nr:hypothetical protein AVEN_220326-1 [Araneus ventricosus]
MHGSSAQITKQSATGHSDPLRIYFPRLPSSNSHLFRFPLERESLSPSSMYLHRFAFQHLWLGSPNDVLGFQKRLKIHTFGNRTPIVIGVSN